MNKNTITIIAIVLMGVMVTLRWMDGRQQQPPPTPIEPQADKVIGVQLPPPPADLNEKGPGDASVSEVPVRQAVSGPEAVAGPVINGPAKMPKDKCLATYKKYPDSVAVYVRRFGADYATEYALCHTIDGSLVNGAHYVRDMEDFERSVVYYRLLYNGAIGADNSEPATQFMRQHRGELPDWTEAQFQKVIADTMTGRIKPDVQWEKSFRFLSGSASSCSALSDNTKRDCLLLADMMAGIKHGKSRFWLYDALAGKGCRNTDDRLVEKYCAGKLLPLKLPKNKGKK